MDEQCRPHFLGVDNDTFVLFENNTVYNNTHVILLESSYQSLQQQKNATASLPSTSEASKYYRQSFDLDDRNPTLIQNVSFVGNIVRGKANGIRLACSPDSPCQNIIFWKNDFPHAPPKRINCKYIASYKVIKDDNDNIMDRFLDHCLSEAKPEAKID